MTSPPDLPAGLTQEEVIRNALIVRDQISTALWPSGGMVLAVLGTCLNAAGLRRSALVCCGLYSATLCWVHNGQAQLLGPIGIAASVVGLFWPAGGRKDSPP